MRRSLLMIVAGLILLVALLAIVSSAQIRYKEAPMLAELVKAGKLPPVEQRLPKEPAMVKPVERVGQYGGTWVRAYRGAADSWAFARLVYDPILRNIAPNGGKIVPNVAKGWDMSSDGKSITLYLREGMKWSDGAPFTADDIMFWYEDIILNDELTPAKPKWMIVGGELGVMERIDDYTVRMSFKEPHAFLLIYLTQFFEFWYQLFSNKYD